MGSLGRATCIMHSNSARKPGRNHMYPSSIYSCSIGHILEHEICHLGCWAGKGKFLKRRNFCLSKQLFEVVFSCFEGQNFFFKFFKKHFCVRIEKLHKIDFIIFFFFFEKVEKSWKNRLPLTIFWSEIVSVIQRGALKTNCI